MDRERAVPGLSAAQVVDGVQEVTGVFDRPEAASPVPGVVVAVAVVVVHSEMGGA
jgi:hypothetical protein